MGLPGSSVARSQQVVQVGTACAAEGFAHSAAHVPERVIDERREHVLGNAKVAQADAEADCIKQAL